MSASVIRKTNIQGDIWPGLPKRFQSFLFFQIQKPDLFKARLKQFANDGRITTAAQACEMKDVIAGAQKLFKSSGQKAPLLPLPGVNIAFASSGLQKLGKFVQTSDQQAVQSDPALLKIFRRNQVRGAQFEVGMYEDLVGEGWDNPQDLRPEYQPCHDPGRDRRQIDGVLLVTSSVESDILEHVKSVTQYFLDDDVVTFPLVREGHVRPGKAKGKEHFGYADGLSQPFIKGLDDTLPNAKLPKNKEPKAMDAGFILCGHKGDPMKQPSWTTDGSFLVIRDLQQLVPEFEEWLQKNGPNAPFCKGSDKPAEKLAAYLMGRWRNGTPVHESPHSDEDESLHASNDFDYEPRLQHDKCPFAAHTRKMRPRSDLSHDHTVIIRRGIPYGPEVSDAEKAAKTSDTAAERERGLIFACYQSDIRSGFNFLTTRWASQHHYPNGKHESVGVDGPGIDPIVGQRLDHHPPRLIALPDGEVPTKHRMELESWVNHKGGEYFFSPSIEAITGYLTGPSDYDLAPKAKL